MPDSHKITIQYNTIIMHVTHPIFKPNINTNNHLIISPYCISSFTCFPKPIKISNKPLTSQQKCAMLQVQHLMESFRADSGLNLSATQLTDLAASFSSFITNNPVQVHWYISFSSLHVTFYLTMFYLILPLLDL